MCSSIIATYGAIKKVHATGARLINLAHKFVSLQYFRILMPRGIKILLRLKGESAIMVGVTSS